MVSLKEMFLYFKINHKKIDFVAERNKNKYGLYTPGSRIKIISEKISKIKPIIFSSTCILKAKF